MERQDVILLRKNLKDSGAAVPYPAQWSSHWKALGHFDEIFIYTLKNPSFFGAIQEEKKRIEASSNDERYYYPLFLVAGAENVMEGFDDKRFIAVVRIHFSSTVELRAQSDALFDNLKECSLPYRCCYATEFSDMVLDFRSDNLQTLTEVVFAFCQREVIGKTYTYFGINVKFLNSSTPTAEDDRLPLFNLRFEQVAPQNNEQIKKALQLIPSAKSYFVSGVDDLLLHSTQVSTQELVALFRCWFQNQSCPASTSTIRLGIDMHIENVAQKKPSRELETLCQKMMHERNMLAEHFRADAPAWFPAISKVACSLARLQSTPVMDEVIYLLAPAVTAFLHYHVCCDCTLPSTVCFSFVEDCTYFMEQLMRIEGQLSQKPEIRPVIYDIPVFMLEYTVAFIREVSLLLEKVDRPYGSEPGPSTVFLLVPHPCERVCAREIIGANAEIAGLIQLQVPEHNLYSPDSFLKIICHELSHYVGEANRNRQKRREFFCTAAADTLARNICRSVRQDIAEIIERDFVRDVCTAPCETLQGMRQLLDACARRNIANYYNAAGLAAGHQEFLYYGCTQMFQKQLSNLELLFRECYADICMLHILNVDAEAYVNSLLHELPETSSGDTRDVFAMRIYAVLTACEKPFRFDSTRYPRVGRYVESVYREIARALQPGAWTLPLCLPFSAVYALTQYVRLCLESLRRNIPEAETKPARDMYQAVTSNISFNGILETISDYRNQLIHVQTPPAK